MAFAYDCDQSVDTVGAVGNELFQSERGGPCITGCIDFRGKQDAPKVRDGYLTRDGADVLNECLNEPVDLEGSPYRSLPLIPNLRTKMEQLRLSHPSEGLMFDETMTGFLQAADCDGSFQKATKSARPASNSAQLSMTVRL